MSKKNILILSSLLLAPYKAIEAKEFLRGYAEFINQKAWQFSSSLGLTSTGSTYDLDGNEVLLSDGQGYSMMDLDLKGTYGINNKFQISGLTKIRKVESQLNESDIESAMGIESLGVEARYVVFNRRKLKVAVGAHYKMSLVKELEENPNDLSSDLAIGDPGGEYGVTAYATYNSYPFKLNGYLGYRSPGSFLTDEIIYNLEGVYSFKSVALNLGVEGVNALVRELADGEQFELAKINPGGVTKYFNSINRSWMNVYAGVYVPFGDFIAGVRLDQVLSGVNTDKITKVGINLIYETKGVTSTEKKISAFKEYAIEGTVLKVSSRGNFVSIDQGLSTDVEKGMKFDIYQTDFYGTNKLVATGVVFDVKSDTAVIKLNKKHKDIKIVPGFAARGY